MEQYIYIEQHSHGRRQPDHILIGERLCTPEMASFNAFCMSDHQHFMRGIARQAGRQAGRSDNKNKFTDTGRRSVRCAAETEGIFVFGHPDLVESQTTLNALWPHPRG